MKTSNYGTSNLNQDLPTHGYEHATAYIKPSRSPLERLTTGLRSMVTGLIPAAKSKYPEQVGQIIREARAGGEYTEVVVNGSRGELRGEGYDSTPFEQMGFRLAGRELLEIDGVQHQIVRWAKGGSEDKKL